MLMLTSNERESDILMLPRPTWPVVTRTNYFHEIVIVAHCRGPEMFHERQSRRPDVHPAR
jgi:hypothetical protein